MGGDSERLISCSKKAEGQIKKVTKEKLNQINKWKKKKTHTKNRAGEQRVNTYRRFSLVPHIV